MTAWDPYAEAYPPRPDAELLRTHARTLDETAEGIVDAVELIESDWSGLEAVYTSPEAPQVYVAVKPVKTTAEEIKADTAAIKSAIEAFADWADTFKARYDALVVRWHGVRRRIASEGDDWREEEDLVNDDNQILKDANALAAEHMAAERACSNAITALYGGITLVETTQEGPATGQQAYGYSAEQLDSATGEGHIPWGQPTEWDKPWYRDAWDGVVSFGKGVWSGITGTVTGLWNMVNFTDGETFAATWKGIGQIALNVAIVSSPITAAVAESIGGPGTVKKAGEELLAVGKAAIHWDDWQRDPAYAAGATAFDLSAILLTAGGGAAAKVGGVANKVTAVSRAGGVASKVLDFSGLTKTAGVTTRALDFSSNLKFTAIDVTTSGFKTVTNTVRPYVSTAGHTITDGLRHASTGLRTGMDNLTTSVRSSADNFANALGGPRVATAGGGFTAPHRFDVEMPSSHSNSTMNFDADGPKPPSGQSGYTLPDRSAPPQYGQRIETPETNAGRGSAPETEATRTAPDAEAPRTAPDAEAPRNTADADAPRSTPDADAPRTAPDAETQPHTPDADAPQPARSDSAQQATDSDSPAAERAPEPEVSVRRHESGRPTEVVIDGETHAVFTRSDQIAVLPRSSNPANWADAESVLQRHLPESDLTRLDDLRGPDGKLPNEVIDNQLAGLIEREFGAPDGNWPKPPENASAVELALAPFTNRYYYDLTDSQATLIHDLRHAMGTGNADTLYQKVMSVDDAAQVLARTDKYPGSVGGFISQAADTARLTRAGEIVNGLRLDYWLDDAAGRRLAYQADKVDEVVAIRFQAKNDAAWENIGIPDWSNRERVGELRYDRAHAHQTNEPELPQDLERRKAEEANAYGLPVETAKDEAVWPNTGHGFTSSRVDGTPVLPELKVNGGTNLRDGAEMWRINSAGEETLVGVYDALNNRWARV
ncbi:hypothetical protein [Arthrobacter sulfonylureivorans]|uniref:Uncharacterized protein n=1 Tax=Arthrobacter sulfonylureivorans TaxID=2486855 RepID=A0ABY3WBW8_9MICC|nr:hypothetical protein [Arthrobacter sulfonylureivorans]UNK46668.1 hypothetical protein MNQ99_04735 [Arthrobacter sulfonylureivorans]